MSSNWVQEYPKRISKHVVAISPSLLSLGEECDDLRCEQCRGSRKLSLEAQELVGKMVAGFKKAMEEYKAKNQRPSFNF